MIFGKYQLLELLGRGGMAEVYKAKSYGVEGFEKLLVIKRILPNLTDNDRFVEMFINEAKIAVTLNHANIVQVFDLGKVGDSYYIAMEFIQGMDLANAIKASNRLGKRIPVELATFMCSEIAKGLDYAHRRRDQNLQPLNIIHRDISPHNILVSFEGEVKVTDFGIAKAKTIIDENDGAMIKGKYAYMAPEQSQGKKHDRRVDIFSLGVVLYEAISGTNPLRGGQSSEITRRALTRNYPNLNELEGLSDLPTEIVDIAARAMSPLPSERFDDAGEFYESLIAFLYNLGARVGTHSLTTFLHDLQEEDDQISPIQNGDVRLMAAFGSVPSTSASQTGSISKVEEGEDISEVTAIQVPTGATFSEDTGTTGSRDLAAEMRDVTVLAVEFAGPAMEDANVDRLASIISQNGGSVVDKRSDIIIGLFGVDIADGRDTLDAISTSLKIQRASVVEDIGDATTQIGIGVHPDKIVMLTDGHPREDDLYFTALASARDLAKKGTGCVITSESGRELANNSFRFEDLTITSVGGVETTLSKVVGRRPLTETYGRLFGRRDELKKIGETLSLVSRGSGRIQALTGEAGTGKTRIMHEVQRRLISGGHDVGWYEAGCVPWRHATPFSAVTSMFRSILGIDEIEREQEIRLKVERLRELGLIPEEVDAIAGLLGVGQGHDVGPDERSRQLRSALIRAASSLSSDKMTIFFWDNLSYVDKESLDILKSLSRSLSHMPLLLALAFRPGFKHAWDSSSIFNKITLSPLSETDSKRLALSRMGARRAPEELLIDVALKSTGNPLYIEEYVKTLVAADVIKVRAGEATYNPDEKNVDFPKTLRGLVGARIKRLPTEQRALLQRAAVMGQRFNVELLSTVTGVPISELRPTLHMLKDAGLLNRISTNEFSFSSDLVRDVVYDGIIFSDRRDIHQAVGHSIEDMFSDRLDEFVERLAVHFREGSERKKAVEYLIRAGEKVAADFSHYAALDYYIKALDLLQNVPRPDLSRILSVYVPIGRLSIKTNQFTLGREKMRLAEELADEVGDTRQLVEIMRINAELQARSDRYQESQQYFQKAIELADELDDYELRCEVRATAGQVYIWLGDLKKSAPYYRQVIEIFRQQSDVDVNQLVSACAQLAKTEANSGDVESAVETLKTAEKHIHEVTNPQTRCEFEEARGQVAFMSRDTEKSLSYTLKALELAKEYDIRDLVAKNAHNIGDTYLSQGDYRKAFTYLRMSQETAKEIGYEVVINLNTIFLSFIDALKFGSNEGLSQLEQALDLANERNTVWEQLQVHYFLGRIHFERNEYAKARSHLEQSIRIGRAANNAIYDAEAVDLMTMIEEAETHTPIGDFLDPTDI